MGRVSKGEGVMSAATQIAPLPMVRDAPFRALLTMRAGGGPLFLCARGETNQCFVIALDQRLFLGARPAFDAALGCYGLIHPFERLSVNERDRPAAVSKAMRVQPLFMLAGAFNGIASRQPGIKGAIRALQNKDVRSRHVFSSGPSNTHTAQTGAQQSPHPEERLLGASRRARESLASAFPPLPRGLRPLPMVRDAAFHAAPHHEGAGVKDREAKWAKARSRPV